MNIFGFFCIIAVAYALPAFDHPALQEKARKLIFEEAEEAKPEKQIYDEQDPVSEADKKHNLKFKEAQQAKPEDQKYDEQNSDSLGQIQDEQKYNEDKPTSSIDEEQWPPIEDEELPGGNTSTEAAKEKKTPKARLVIPEPPSFSTRLSVPSLPISLSSLPSLRIKWPIRVPDIFKPPKIVYLG